MVTRKNNAALKYFDKCNKEDQDLIGRIINSWLDIDPDHVLKIVQSLNGDYTLLAFLLAINDENLINSIKNKNDDPIPASNKLALSLVTSFINLRQNEFAPLTVEVRDHSQASRKEFYAFAAMHTQGANIEYDKDEAKRSYDARVLEQERLDDRKNAAAAGITGTSNTTDVTNSNINTTASIDPDELRVQQRLLDFEKKTKLDPKMWPILKSPEHWRVFEANMSIMCAIHGFTECIADEDPVFDDERKADTSKDDEALYGKRKQYLYSVLFQAVKGTEKGREILQKHVKTLDGRMVYKDLYEHHAGPGGILAKAREQKLLDRINGQIESNYNHHRVADLISAWMQDVRQYEDLRGKFSPDDLLSKMEHYIAPVKELRQVASMGGMITTVATGGMTSLTAEQQIKLYERQSLLFDQENKKAILGKRATLNHELHIHMLLQEGIHSVDADYRVVNHTLLDFANLDDEEYIEAYMNEMKRQPNSSLKKAAWDSLTPPERELWDKFSPEAKNMILSSRSLPSTIRPRSMRTRRDGDRSTGPRTDGPPVSHRALVNSTGTSDATDDYDSDVALVANLTELLDLNTRSGFMVQLVQEDPPTIDLTGDDAPTSAVVTPSNDKGEKKIGGPEQGELGKDMEDDEISDSDDDSVNVLSRAIDNDLHDRLSRPSNESNSSFAKSTDRNKRMKVVRGMLTGCTQEVYQSRLANLNEDDKSAFLGATLSTYANILGQCLDNKDAVTLDIMKAIGESRRAHEHITNGTLNTEQVRRPVFNPSGELATYTETLVDRGANGGIGGKGLRLIALSFPPRTIKLHQVSGPALSNVKLGNFGAVAMTRSGHEVILIFHEYAVVEDGRTIHSSLQLEHGGIHVCDVHPEHGGLLELNTSDGLTFPMAFRQGLPYLRLRPFTDDEWNRYPHYTVTNASPWNNNMLQYDRDPVMDLDSPTFIEERFSERRNERNVNMVRLEEDGESVEAGEEEEVDGNIAVHRVEQIALGGQLMGRVVDVASLDLRFNDEAGELYSDGFEFGLQDHITDLYHTVEDRSIVAPGMSCNLGIAGRNMRRLSTVSGRYGQLMDDYGKMILEAPIGNFACVTTTTGIKEVLLVCNNYLEIPYSTSVHCPSQITLAGNDVRNHPSYVGIGTDYTITARGHVMFLTSHEGLQRINIRPPTDAELQSLPRVELTASKDPHLSDGVNKVYLHDPISELVKFERRNELGIPHNREQARMDDRSSGDNKWSECEDKAILKAMHERDDGSYAILHDADQVEFEYSHAPSTHAKIRPVPVLKCRVTAPNVPEMEDWSNVQRDTMDMLVGHTIDLTHESPFDSYVVEVLDTFINPTVDTQERGTHPDNVMLEGIATMISEDVPTVERVLLPYTYIHYAIHEALLGINESFMDNVYKRRWYRLRYSYVMDELMRFAVEIMPLEMERRRILMNDDIGNSDLLFIVKYGDLILKSRSSERDINESIKKALEGPQSSTRNKLNARVKGSVRIHNMIKAHTLIAPQTDNMVVHETLREPYRPHLLMFSAELLEEMRRYGHDHITMIEGLIFGRASGHQELDYVAGQSRRLAGGSPALRFTPYYEEISEQPVDTSSLISDEMPTEHEYMVSFGTNRTDDGIMYGPGRRVYTSTREMERHRAMREEAMMERFAHMTNEGGAFSNHR